MNKTAKQFKVAYERSLIHELGQAKSVLKEYTSTPGHEPRIAFAYETLVAAIEFSINQLKEFYKSYKSKI